MHAYFDAFSGVSGDMIVGAFLDLGLALSDIDTALEGLGVEGGELTLERCEQGSIQATKFAVHALDTREERSFATIRAMLERGMLPAPVRVRALAAFTVLAEAEAKIHGTNLDQVHFHELGSVDAIADVVGAALGVEMLGITAIYVSPLPLGTGLVQSMHGPLPVPAPATAELLRGFAVRAGEGEGEMVTPTGAAILRGFGAISSAPPVMRVNRVGYGAGTRRLVDRPNMLRVLLGDPEPGLKGLATDEMLVIEANIDDMNPEFYEHAAARLFAAGAVDVTLVPAQMKKGRPGVLLRALAPPELRDRVAAVLFAETTTIGVRFHSVGRFKLERRVEEVWTPYGPIAVKISGGAQGTRTVAPEYESCRRAAERHQVALRVVYEAARRAAG